MGNDLKTVLAVALDIPVPGEACTIQRSYDAYKSKLCGLEIVTPLGESVAFFPENFPHLVKLQYCGRGSSPTPAKCPVVIPSLDAGEFNDEEYTFDPRRERALLNVAQLLRTPHSIHKNLRHGQRGPKAIRGEHVYVQKRKKDYWVAFTLFDPRLRKAVVVSAFYVNGTWLKGCACEPPLYSEIRSSQD